MARCTEIDVQLTPGDEDASARTVYRILTQFLGDGGLGAASVEFFVAEVPGDGDAPTAAVLKARVWHEEHEGICE